jgi:acetyl-CoA carboxylase beta subunit
LISTVGLLPLGAIENGRFIGSSIGSVRGEHIGVS